MWVGRETSSLALCPCVLISETLQVHSSVVQSPASPQSPEKSTQSQSMMKIECCIPIPIVCMYGYYNYHVNLGRYRQILCSLRIPSRLPVWS